MASRKGNSAVHHRNRPVPAEPMHAAAVAIAQRPVSEWRTALAAVPEPERFAVRADLTEIHNTMKLHAELDKAIAERKDVWIAIPEGFMP